MNNLNKCMFIGNLGKDAELRYTSSNDAVLNFTVAVNERYTTKAGEKRDNTEWVSCTLWGKRGEALAQYMKKGLKLYVEGKLATRSWESEGKKNYKTEIKVSDVELLGEKKSDNEGWD